MLGRLRMILAAAIGLHGSAFALELGAMKSMMLTSLALIAAIAATVGPVSASWARALDARPEAFLTGTALLLLASILRRRSVAQRRIK